MRVLTFSTENNEDTEEPARPGPSALLLDEAELFVITSPSRFASERGCHTLGMHQARASRPLSSASTTLALVKHVRREHAYRGVSPYCFACSSQDGMSVVVVVVNAANAVWGQHRCQSKKGLR